MKLCYKKYNQYFLLLFLGSILSAEVLAQKTQSVETAFVEATFYGGSNKQLPFWMRANQYGIVPQNGPSAGIRAGIFSDYTTQPDERGKKPWVQRKVFDWGYGAEIVANGGLTNRVVIPELFVKARIGHFEGYVGKRREKYGLADSTLGIGPYSWSGNAPTIPKIQVGFYDWTPLRITRDLISFQGILAHGWMDHGNAFVRKSYLHQKTFYGKLGKPNWKVRLIGGFNHQAQWGGYAPSFQAGGSNANFKDRNFFFQKDGSLPGGLDTYFDVFTGLSNKADTVNFNTYDGTNRSGNHIGSIDLGMEIDLENVNILMYRQQFYESGALYYLANITDGLQGISVTSKATEDDYDFFIKKFVVEILTTTDQGQSGRRIFKKRVGQEVWGENYFNHGQYTDGWSYRGRGIGTPFVAPFRDFKDGFVAPAFYDEGFMYTNNNRVFVVHAGLMGTILQTWHFEAKASYSKNYGTLGYEMAGTPKQFSFLTKVHRRSGLLGGSEISGTFAGDFGGLYPSGIGLSLAVKKTWGQEEELSNRRRRRR